jgi:hypothetical protein
MVNLSLMFHFGGNQGGAIGPVEVYFCLIRVLPDIPTILVSQS